MRDLRASPAAWRRLDAGHVAGRRASDLHRLRRVRGEAKPDMIISMAAPRHVFHVLFSGGLWEEVSVESGRPAADLRFIGSFDGQPAALVEARRRAWIVAPATIYVLSLDGSRTEVIQIGAGS
jgi:hypothetical protein